MAPTPVMTERSDAALAAGRELGALGGGALGDWTLEAVDGALGGAVILQFRRGVDGARLPVEVRPRGQRRALVTTAVGDVSYLGAEGLAEREAHRLTLAIAELLERGALPILRFFPHLAMPDARLDAAAGDRARQEYAALLGPQLAQMRLLGSGGETGASVPEERRTLHFDALGIAELLAPEVAIDGAPVAGFVLRAIYPPAAARRQATDYGRFALEFEALAGETGAPPIARVQLAANASERSAFGRVGPLALSLLGYDGDPDRVPLALSTLTSWLLALLRLKCGATLAVHVPSGPEEVRALSLPHGRTAAPSPASPQSTAAVSLERGAPRALNLAIDAPCRQQCAFCSVQRYVRPHDGGEVELARLRQQLRAAREQGIREVRLNGIDPLAFSAVLDVVSDVAALGFPELSVYSPCRQLADAGFRRELLRRAPQRLRITVPLYGITAATHDRVTGAAGAHAEVMQAIDGLRRDMPSGALYLSTVIVTANLHELLDIARHARALGVPLHARLPYPMRPTADDPYADAALREADIVRRLIEAVRTAPDEDRALAYELLRDVIPHPCVLFRAEQATGEPVFPAMHLREQSLLPGTEYRSSDFAHTTDAQPHGDAFAPAVVACPHAARCALASVCPREQFSVYAQLYGLDELSPVLPGELYAQPPHPAQRAPRGGALFG